MNSSLYGLFHRCCCVREEKGNIQFHHWNACEKLFECFKHFSILLSIPFRRCWLSPIIPGFIVHTCFEMHAYWMFGKRSSMEAHWNGNLYISTSNCDDPMMFDVDTTPHSQQKLGERIHIRTELLRCIRERVQPLEKESMLCIEFSLSWIDWHGSAEIGEARFQFIICICTKYEWWDGIHKFMSQMQWWKVVHCWLDNMMMDHSIVVRSEFRTKVCDSVRAYISEHAIEYQSAVHVFTAIFVFVHYSCSRLLTYFEAIGADTYYCQQV